jgi:DNA replication and repair protein RecF
MRITRIRTVDFRNLNFADVNTDNNHIFLTGDNGQGKTNLLEAAGLISSFRSFRTNEISPLIRQSCKEARVRLDVIDHSGEQIVEIQLAKGSRKAVVNNTPVRSVSQHLGNFPTVVFCSDDLRLIRGQPSNRRRWLDAAIGSTDANYLNAVRDYHRALEGRNALLKSERPSEDELKAFEKIMYAAAVIINKIRLTVIPELAETLRLTCTRSGFSNKGADLVFKADSSIESLAELWEKNRPAEKITGTTLRGPQKDDFTILFEGQEAADFASEGQQRLLVLALCLGRLRRDQERTPTPPVILADDVLGGSMIPVGVPFGRK